MSNYNCPHCNADLNVGGKIILAFKRKKGKDGLFLMSEELGDYSIVHSPSISLAKDEKLHFYCPCCSRSLEYKNNENLARIFRRDETDEETSVIFSAIFGEKSTYQVSQEKQLSFGEHALRYMQPDWYKNN